MTVAERQRRRRKRIAEAERTAALERRRARVKISAEDIRCWKLFTVQTPLGERTYYAPVSRPAAAVADNLSDADILALLKQLTELVRKRGL